MERYKISMILDSLRKSIINVSVGMSAYDPEDKIRKDVTLIENCLVSYRILLDEFNKTNNDET